MLASGASVLSLHVIGDKSAEFSLTAAASVADTTARTARTLLSSRRARFTSGAPHMSVLGLVSGERNRLSR